MKSVAFVTLFMVFLHESLDKTELGLKLKTALYCFLSYKLLRFIQQIFQFATKKRNQYPFSHVPYTVPSPHWLYGHIQLVGTLSGQEYLTLENADIKSGISTFWSFNTPVLAVLKGSHVREVYNHSPHRMKIPIVSRHFEKLLGRKSLLMLKGEDWDAARSKAHSAVFQGALKLNTQATHKASIRAINRIRSKIRGELHHNGQNRLAILDAREFCTKMIFDVFGMSFLGIDFGYSNGQNNDQQYIESLQFLLEDMNYRCYDFKSFLLNNLYWLPTEQNRKYHTAKKMILNCIDESVCEDFSKSSTPLTENETKTETVKHASQVLFDEGAKDDYLHDIMFSFWVGGYDTTSATLSYCLYNAARFPKIKEECLLEISQKLPHGISEPIDNLAKILPFCNAVLMETIRLFPTGPNTARNLDRKLSIPERDITFEKGTRVFISIWSIHRYEGNFHRALEYLPHRWVRKVKENDSDTYRWVERSTKDLDSETEQREKDYCRPANKSNFFAFSGGKRYCLGEKYALNVALTIFIHFIMNFDLKLKDDYELLPTKSGFVQGPKGGVPLIFRERNHHTNSK